MVFQMSSANLTDGGGLGRCEQDARNVKVGRWRLQIVKIKHEAESIAKGGCGTDLKAALRDGAMTKLSKRMPPSVVHT